MKRFSIAMTAFIFLVGSASFGASDVHAVKKNNSTYEQLQTLQDNLNNGMDNDTDPANDGQYRSNPSQKDTSWFDYENPKKSYRISTEGQLIGLASLVNEEQVEKWKPTRVETFEGVTFTLAKDIKLTQAWTPIAYGRSAKFAGVLDGNGHTISNLRIINSSGAAGFFGYLSGEVKNLTLDGTITSEGGDCGAFAGYLQSSGKVTGCTSRVMISAKDRVGGIVGYNEGAVIEDCINIGDVSGTLKIGGVVGENWGGSVKQCGNYGTVKSSKRGVATFGTGGVCGRSVSAQSSVKECYNMGKILSDTEATGGVVGYMNAEGATLEDSYSVGTIKILNEKKRTQVVSAWAGGVVGIVGTSGIHIRNCYNSGEIVGADKIGGVIGRYIGSEDRDKQNNETIRNNYYHNGAAKDAIGEIDGAAAIPNDAARMFSSGSSLASALGIAYKSDDSGLYGNNGCPVLRWQEPIDATQRNYLSGIAKEIQLKLDHYLVKNADKPTPGRAIMMYLNNTPGANSSVILYDNAKNQETEKDSGINE